ncbi:hypothetical protein WJX74_006533 [Apatococcus lobatus]|uniref:Uncharacterized protein n=2 Tax=Apatococcus TaxID=904362 RepID=A0AAW1SM52_9CHLO
MEQWPTIKIITSDVVPFSVEHCWPIARDFGQIQLLFDGMDVHGRPQTVRSGMLDGAPGTCIGALRFVDFGPIRLIQELDAVDDEAHVIKWHAVAHPLNKSEFPGSFVNDSYSIHMTPISTSSATYVELRGQFITEPENVQAMTAFLDNMQETAVGGITRCLLNSQGRLSHGSDRGQAVSASWSQPSQQRSWERRHARPLVIAEASPGSRLYAFLRPQP